ncbi:MAG: F0F1 ATP synthase subunit B [Gammaproteobacteria bacterium]|nr:F0F1 ATP synthase subunit B [Gammaproteobacteria bacterium]
MSILLSSLFGQAITFAIFVWFTMRFVWPFIIKAMEQREQIIADGLAAAERGHYELKKAHEQASDELNRARVQASDIIDKAHQRANAIVEEAEVAAKAKCDQILLSAQSELKQKEIKLREELRQQVVNIAVLGAEKILKKSIDAKAQNDLIVDLVKQL